VRLSASDSERSLIACCGTPMFREPRMWSSHFVFRLRINVKNWRWLMPKPPDQAKCNMITTSQSGPALIIGPTITSTILLVTPRYRDTDTPRCPRREKKYSLFALSTNSPWIGNRLGIMLQLPIQRCLPMVDPDAEFQRREMTKADCCNM
jgi:hypothetical protein